MNSVAQAKFWMPEDKPEYLSLHRSGSKTGRQETKDQFLLDQAELLRMLVAEASPGEIGDANRRIQDGLPENGAEHLPSGLLNNPATPQALIWTYPAEPGSMLADWRDGIMEALEAPEASPEDLKDEVSNLSLESFLCRLL
jgi:hypothetical protein